MRRQSVIQVHVLALAVGLVQTLSRRTGAARVQPCQDECDPDTAVCARAIGAQSV